MEDQVTQIKRLAAMHLEHEHALPPHLRGAINWVAMLDKLDAAFQTYEPMLGSLAPPQIAAVAALLAEAVHLASGFAGGGGGSAQFPMPSE